MQTASIIKLQIVAQPSCKHKTNEERGTSTMFSIKQVANSLQMSTQAIYKQKQELIDKGYMIKNEQGNWEITDTGFNYLQDKKIAYMQQHTTNNVQPVTNQQIKEEVKEENEEEPTFDIPTNDKVANIIINHYKEQLQTVTSQLQEMTEQRNYFKAKFEEKDRLLNEYLNHHLLTTGDNQEEANNQEQPKKTFFQRLFNK